MAIVDLKELSKKYLFEYIKSQNPQKINNDFNFYEPNISNVVVTQEKEKVDTIASPILPLADYFNENDTDLPQPGAEITRTKQVSDSVQTKTINGFKTTKQTKKGGQIKLDINFKILGSGVSGGGSGSYDVTESTENNFSEESADTKTTTHTLSVTPKYTIPAHSKLQVTISVYGVKVEIPMKLEATVKGTQSVGTGSDYLASQTFHKDGNLYSASISADKLAKSIGSYRPPSNLTLSGNASSKTLQITGAATALIQSGVAICYTLKQYKLTGELVKVEFYKVDSNGEDILLYSLNPLENPIISDVNGDIMLGTDFE